MAQGKDFIPWSFPGADVSVHFQSYSSVSRPALDRSSCSGFDRGCSWLTDRPSHCHEAQESVKQEKKTDIRPTIHVHSYRNILLTGKLISGVRCHVGGWGQIFLDEVTAQTQIRHVNLLQVSGEVVVDASEAMKLRELRNIWIENMFVNDDIG